MTATPTSIVLRPGHVTLADLRAIAAGGVRLTLDAAALPAMHAAQAAVDRIVEADEVVYGINTGFGKLASTKIAHDRLAELQRNLVLSHSVGTGEALGDVMKESIEAARTVVRSRAQRFGIKNEVFEKTDIHIHVPEGATPKDGPSAGIGMTTALVSAFTGIPVRADVAMTGEITLRGEVLPIGGLKEKLLAAHRGGIKTVLIPEQNVKDLAEIPDNVKNKLEIVPVRWIEKVLEVALERQPEALADVPAVAVAPAPSEGQSEVVKH